jgi:hypothetical protein
MAGSKVLSAEINKVLDQSLSNDLSVHPQYNPFEFNPYNETYFCFAKNYSSSLNVRSRNCNVYLQRAYYTSVAIYQECFKIASTFQRIKIRYMLYNRNGFGVDILFTRFDGTVVFADTGGITGMYEHFFIITSEDSNVQYYELECFVQANPSESDSEVSITGFSLEYL